MVRGSTSSTSTAVADPTAAVSEFVEVVVGRIGKPHGLRGEVTVELRTDEPERRFAPSTTLLADPPRGSASAHRSLSVASTRWHQQTLLVTFNEIADRTAAEAARGIMLSALIAADATPEDPEEFYDHQLIGVDVLNLEGELIGTITGITHGAQDLLQIKATDERDTLVPFVAALVPTVDLKAGHLVVADRPGLVSPFADDA